MTHKFLMERGQQPVCTCGAVLTIKHILAECNTTKNKRETLFPNTRNKNSEQVMSCLLSEESIKVDKLMNYLTEINIIDKI